MKRFELYKAAKYEVCNFYYDCGMTLPEMWTMISKDVQDMNDTEYFWYNTCISDYNEKAIY